MSTSAWVTMPLPSDASDVIAVTSKNPAITMQICTPDSFKGLALAPRELAVYILLWPAAADGAFQAYVGKGRAADRLADHLRKKKGWIRAIVTTFNDGGFNTTEAGRSMCLRVRR